MSPFRSDPDSPLEEEELWLRLDEALWMALRDPRHAWSLAWAVASESRRFPDLAAAVGALLAVLSVDA